MCKFHIMSIKINQSINQSISLSLSLSLSLDQVFLAAVNPESVIDGKGFFHEFAFLGEMDELMGTWIEADGVKYFEQNKQGETVKR